MFHEQSDVQRITPRLEELVERGSITPGLAADISLQVFTTSLRRGGIGEAGEEAARHDLDEGTNESLQELLTDLDIKIT